MKDQFPSTFPSMVRTFTSQCTQAKGNAIPSQERSAARVWTVEAIKRARGRRTKCEQRRVGARERPKSKPSLTTNIKKAVQLGFTAIYQRTSLFLHVDA